MDLKALKFRTATMGKFSRSWQVVRLVCLFLAVFLGGCEDQESKGHLSLLKKLATETPLYPGFKQVDISENDKPGRARFFLYYNSQASYEEVKVFYSRMFLAKGWELSSKEDRGSIFSDLSDSALVFRKGEYQVAILRESLDQNPAARNYVISYVWEQP